MFNWKSPYERFYTFLAYRDGVVATPRKPQQAHLQVFGCKTFALARDTQMKKDRAQKLNPKAWIGYLVGYNSTNIYRIWNPRTNKIVVIRDVTFNEKERFNGNLQTLKDDLLKVSSEELEVLLPDVEIPPTPSQNTSEHDSTNLYEDEDLSKLEGIGHGERLEENLESESGDRPGAQVCRDDNKPHAHGVEDQRSGSYETDHLWTDDCTIPYLTPDQSPTPPAALLVAAIRESASAAEESEVREPESPYPAVYPIVYGIFSPLR